MGIKNDGLPRGGQSTHMGKTGAFPPGHKYLLKKNMLLILFFSIFPIPKKHGREKKTQEIRFIFLHHHHHHKPLSCFPSPKILSPSPRHQQAFFFSRGGKYTPTNVFFSWFLQRAMKNGKRGGNTLCYLQFTRPPRLPTV